MDLGCRAVPRSGRRADSDVSKCEDPACCWICLDAGGGLERPCACPRASHTRCLARWQLQQAGRPEERACRFCGGALPDWRRALGPGSAAGCACSGLEGATCGCAPLGGAAAVVVDDAGSRARMLYAAPDPAGMAAFKQQVQDLMHYNSDCEFDVVFNCRVPGTGERLQLSGFGAYDAAVHCAAAAAAARSRAAPPRGGHHVGRGSLCRRLPFVEHTGDSGSLGAATDSAGFTGIDSCWGSCTPDASAPRPLPTCAADAPLLGAGRGVGGAAALQALPAAPRCGCCEIEGWFNLRPRGRSPVNGAQLRTKH